MKKWWLSLAAAALAAGGLALASCGVHGTLAACSYSIFGPVVTVGNVTMSDGITICATWGDGAIVRGVQTSGVTVVVLPGSFPGRSIIPFTATGEFITIVLDTGVSFVSVVNAAGGEVIRLFSPGIPVTVWLPGGPYLFYVWA